MSFLVIESFRVLFLSRPFPGALFPSVISPQKGLDALSRATGPHILLFHEKRGLVLFSPSVRSLWPGADLGQRLEDLRLFTEDGIVPAEMHHLSSFWERISKNSGDCADMFVIKAGRIRQVFMLGFCYFRFPWGRLVIIVPGENPRELGGRIADPEAWLTPSLRETLSTWMEDSDREALMGTALSSMPEDLRHMALVERHVPGSPDDSRPGYRLSYRVRGGEWQRDAANGGESPKEEKAVHMGGKVVDGEVAIGFSVYVGGIRSLGTLFLPLEKMPETGLARLNSFLHETSEALCLKARETALPEFSYCRHWVRGGFRLEALREVAAELSPGDIRNIPVLPLWFPPDQDPLPLLMAIDRARYVTDILFVDEEKRAGCLLLRDVPREKAAMIREKILRDKTRVAIDPPMTLGECLDTL